MIFKKKTVLWVKALNKLYKIESALYEEDFNREGFEWLDCSDVEQSTLSFIRKGSHSDDIIAVFCNFTPVCRSGYRIGVPLPGKWKKLLNSDDLEFLGSGYMDNRDRITDNMAFHGRPYSLSIDLPPLAIIIYKYEGCGNE